MKACNFIKKEALTQLFSCEYWEIVKKIFFIEHLWWLFLEIFSKVWGCFCLCYCKMFLMEWRCFLQYNINHYGTMKL